MKVSLIFRPAQKAETQCWKPGLVLNAGDKIQCFGNDLFAVIETARQNRLAVTTLARGKGKSEWLATLSKSEPLSASQAGNQRLGQHGQQPQPKQTE